MAKNLKPGQRRCICAACGEAFTGLEAFDKHRTGNHMTNRRCMTIGEMYEHGMREDTDGYWKAKDKPNPRRV